MHWRPRHDPLRLSPSWVCSQPPRVWFSQGTLGMPAESRAQSRPWPGPEEGSVEADEGCPFSELCRLARGSPRPLVHTLLAQAGGRAPHWSSLSLFAHGIGSGATALGLRERKGCHTSFVFCHSCLWENVSNLTPGLQDLLGAAAQKRELAHDSSIRGVLWKRSGVPGAALCPVKPDCCHGLADRRAGCPLSN